MSGTELLLKSFGIAYRGYMAWKFEHLMQKAEAHGLTEKELYNSDRRFALYMRMGRAFESCSEKEVVDYLADAMIGCIKSGDADEKPDFVQMAISSLNGITKLELDIILEMHKEGVYWPSEYTMESETDLDSRFEKVRDKIDLDLMVLSTILNGLSKTGLVTPPPSGAGGVLAHGSNRLTPLARELFHYVDYARRLT